MRLVILTSGLEGTAALCAAELARDPGITIAAVICSQGATANPWNRRRRQLRKMWNVGLLGILNGRRIGPWFNTRMNERLQTVSLDVTAAKHGIPLHYTPTVNCAETIELVRAAHADLGVALGGNPYISESVYSLPRCGMINIHAELLPEFQGAQSVIWQLHEGSSHTGYTIHQMDRHIDTGSILYREAIPIEFRRTLAETVTHNCVRIARATSKSLPYVVRNYERLAAAATAQPPGRFFTTPTLRQYLTMLKQHKALSSGTSSR